MPSSLAFPASGCSTHLPLPTQGPSPSPQSTGHAALHAGWGSSEVLLQSSSSLGGGHVTDRLRDSCSEWDALLLRGDSAQT